MLLQSKYILLEYQNLFRIKANDLYMGRAPFLGMFHRRSSVQ